MKNNYIVNEKKVLDIILKPTKSGKIYMVEYFLLDNGTEVKAKKCEIQVQCHECGEWKSYKYGKRYVTQCIRHFDGLGSGYLRCFCKTIYD